MTTLTPAEDVFAYMLRLKRPSKAVLRESLVRLRAQADTGLQTRLLESQDARRRAAHERRGLLAARRGAGGVIGQASAAELLHAAPLPMCERWGDVASQGYSSLDCALGLHEALAHRQRPTLPHAAMVSAGNVRVGPHGTIDGQLRETRLVARSYRELTDEAAARCHGGRGMSYGVAVHANVSLLPQEDLEEAGGAKQDEAAAQQDGTRVWPPEAMGDKDRMPPLTAALEAMASYLNTHALLSPTPGLGTASIDVYRRGCAEASASLGGKASGDFRQLGLCAFTKDARALVGLQRRALLLAVTAHAQPGGEGQEELSAFAKAALKLSGLMVRCA